MDPESVSHALQPARARVALAPGSVPVRSSLCSSRTRHPCGRSGPEDDFSRVPVDRVGHLRPLDDTDREEPPVRDPKLGFEISRQSPLERLGPVSHVNELALYGPTGRLAHPVDGAGNRNGVGGCGGALSGAAEEEEEYQREDRYPYGAVGYTDRKDRQRLPVLAHVTQLLHARGSTPGIQPFRPRSDLAGLQVEAALMPSTGDRSVSPHLAVVQRELEVRTRVVHRVKPVGGADEQDIEVVELHHTCASYRPPAPCGS
jgi:hypothetical protein